MASVPHPVVDDDKCTLNWAAIMAPEPWREVAAFTNSWVNYGGSRATAAFYIDMGGRVHLKGSIKSGTSTASAFTLPLNYRPALDLVFQTTAGAIVVTSTGTVVPTVSATTDVPLDGISFRAK